MIIRSGDLECAREKTRDERHQTKPMLAQLPLTAITAFIGIVLVVVLQAMAVSTGLPLTLVLLAACYGVVRGLMNEPRG